MTFHTEGQIAGFQGTEIPLPESHFRRLGIGSRTTFFRWERMGLVVMKIGGRRFVRPSDLNAFIERMNDKNKQTKKTAKGELP